MMLTATCFPGLNSAVRIRWQTPEWPALVLYLEPGSVAIEVPPVADGDLVLSRFLREISCQAIRLATELEARRIQGVPPDEPLTSRQVPKNSNGVGEV